MLDTVKTEQVKFTPEQGFEAAVLYTSNKNTEYVPIEGNQLIMTNSGTLNGWTFAYKGIEDICKDISLPSLAKSLHTKTINHWDSYEYFNAVMATEESQRKLKKKRLVVEDGCIIGTVGSKYVHYPNSEFLTDIAKIVPSDYTFTGGNVVGSKMRVNFGSESLSFDVKGRVNDKIVPGIQFRTSHVGDTVIGALVRLYRYKCLNGMTITDTKSDNRAYHVGDDLRYKLSLMTQRTNNSLSKVQERIDRLLGIDYILGESAGDLLYNNAPVRILPEHKKRSALFNPKTKYKDEKVRDEVLLNSIKILDNIPNDHGGPISREIWNSSFRERKSYFDWTESFTEAAQSYSIEEQNLIEEEAGVLSSYIYDNATLLN